MISWKSLSHFTYSITLSPADCQTLITFLGKVKFVQIHVPQQVTNVNIHVKTSTGNIGSVCLSVDNIIGLSVPKSQNRFWADLLFYRKSPFTHQNIRLTFIPLADWFTADKMTSVKSTDKIKPQISVRLWTQLLGPCVFFLHHRSKIKFNTTVSMHISNSSSVSVSHYL